MSMLLSVTVMFGMFAQAKVGVDGEFDRVLEVEMYGSRPVDSLVVPSRQDYYKYEELSDGDNPSVTSVSPDSNHHHPGDFTKSGYNKKIGGGGRGGKGHHHHSDQRQAHTHHHHGPGSCYQCSSLTDKTGYCKDIKRYEEDRQKYPNNSNLPELEMKCSLTERFCQVRRIEYKVDNMSGYEEWSLERSCARTCEPFCVSMGGRTKVTYCTSCCRWDGFYFDEQGILRQGERNEFCNTDNSGHNIEEHLLLHCLLLLFLRL